MKKPVTIILILLLSLMLYQPIITVQQKQTLAKKVIVLDPGHGGYQ